MLDGLWWSHGHVRCRCASHQREAISLEGADERGFISVCGFCEDAVALQDVQANWTVHGIMTIATKMYTWLISHQKEAHYKTRVEKGHQGPCGSPIKTSTFFRQRVCKVRLLQATPAGVHPFLAMIWSRSLVIRLIYQSHTHIYVVAMKPHRSAWSVVTLS